MGNIGVGSLNESAVGAILAGIDIVYQRLVGESIGGGTRGENGVVMEIVKVVLLLDEGVYGSCHLKEFFIVEVGELEWVSQ